MSQEPVALKILEYPNDALRVETIGVEKITPELQKTAQEMYKVMIEAKGTGLAATQVGLNIRLLVLDDHGEPIYAFNPVILKKSKDTIYEIERCLSFPDEERKIKRAKEVTVKFRDLYNKMQYQIFEGILAVAIQHEVDHLHGILFIDKENKK